MSHKLFRIVPVESAANDESVRRDCAVITALMDKRLEADAAATPLVTYRRLQQQLSAICVFHWDLMRVEITATDVDSSK